MSKKSTQIALGGMFSALCVVLMFMTGLFPFATYAIPMLAGAMLIPVVVENGVGTAVLVYVSVSLLSALVVPDREAALMFIAFFGYYPIVKGRLERLRPRALEMAVKFLLFNAAVVGSYAAVIYLLGMPDLLGGLEDFGRYGVAILLGTGNLVFLMYDFALTRYVSIYIRWFKPTFLRR